MSNSIRDETPDQDTNSGGRAAPRRRLRAEDLRFLFLEGIVVLVGVVLALMVDEWREERALQQRADEARRQLNAEIVLNLEELQRSYESIGERFEILRALQPEMNGSRSFLSFLGRFQGYNTPDLSSIAWERASEQAIVSRLPTAYLTQAFELYERNEDLEYLETDINRLIYSEDFYLPEKAFVAWAISERIMSQQLSWLRELIEFHEAFLATYARP